jgi:uncharacterized protein YcbX
VRVAELWRYPVKSLRGEPLGEFEVGRGGVVGDRTRAVIDIESGVSLSAKRHAELLTCRAWTKAGVVMVGMPDGSQFDADSLEASAALSLLLDRGVEIRTAVGDRRVRHEYTTDTTTGGGNAMVVEAAAVHAFFDGAPLHMVTTATLRELARHAPDSVFAAERFRPNVLVDVEMDGFVEAEWVGKELQVGDVSVRVTDHKTRCVMTTRAQGDLPKDLTIFKTVNAVNERRAGIELEPTSSGTIRLDDRVVITE